MNLGRRIKYYMVGALIGGLLSYFIFNGRGCEWLPGARVLKSIQTSKVITSEKDHCLIKCNNISADQIYQLIENGSIDFGNSDVENRNYIITNDSLTLNIQIVAKDTTAIVNTIRSVAKNCNCEQESEDKFTLLYQPNSIVLEKLKELTLSIKEETQCELDCFAISSSSVDSLFKQGNVLFEQSYPNRVPNPIYYILLNIEGKDFLFWIEQGATKTRLKHVVNYNKNNLKQGEPLSSLFEQSMRIKDCNCY
jgi:hypothetical protein